jgi:hypothetical protein
MSEQNDSIGNAVRKMMTDAKVVAALSDQTPPTPDTERLAKMYERLWSAFEDSRARIEYLEVQLTHFADLRWKN